MTTLENALLAFRSTGGEFKTFIGQTDHGMIPVGFATSAPFQNRNWVHAFWFPEASPRNKLELWVRLLVASERVAVVSPPPFVPFYRQICHYGVLRPVGKFRGLYDGEDGMLYESV